MPKLTKKYLGFYEQNELVGVVTLGWGTQPTGTIKKIFYNHNFKTNDYLEIGKMCFLPDKNKTNFGSKSISILIKWLKSHTTISFLYTLADGIMGKCGYVYQASNFKYIGKFKTSVYMDRETKEKIHPRSANRLCVENAKHENKKKVFWLTHSFCEYKGIDKINGYMFRYIYPMNKKMAKLLKGYSKYNALKNPKNEDLWFEKRINDNSFEQIEMPDFNMKVFNFNYQDWGEKKDRESLFR